MQKGAFSEFLTQHLQELDDDEGKFFYLGSTKKYPNGKCPTLKNEFDFFYTCELLNYFRHIFTPRLYFSHRQGVKKHQKI